MIWQIYKPGNSSDLRFYNSGADKVTFQNSTGNVGIGTTNPSYTLHVNGSVAGTSAYNNLSDLRLKKDIATIGRALDIVGKLRGVRFRWRVPKERAIGKDFKLPVDDPQVRDLSDQAANVGPAKATVRLSLEPVT